MFRFQAAMLTDDKVPIVPFVVMEPVRNNPPCGSDGIPALSEIRYVIATAGDAPSNANAVATPKSFAFIIAFPQDPHTALCRRR